MDESIDIANNTQPQNLGQFAIETIADTANKKLLSKFKGNTAKLNKFLSDVTAILEPFNIPIDSTAGPIQPQGTANAVLLADGSGSSCFIAFKKTEEMIDIYLAALALSKMQDDVGAISTVNALIDAIKTTKKSKTASKSAGNKRSRRRPIVVYFEELKKTEAYRTGQRNVKDMFNNLEKTKNDRFSFNRQDTTIGFTYDKDDEGILEWVATEIDTGKNYRGKLNFKQFNTMVGNIRGKKADDI